MQADVGNSAGETGGGTGSYKLAKASYFEQLLNLYIACGDYRDANHIAILLAWQKCSSISISTARNFLLKICHKLPEKSRTSDFNNCLYSLQSYCLVKIWSKLDSVKSTYLLNRVLQNLSKFGSADTQTSILMTAAFEAHKANLKATSFKHAKTALQSQGGASLPPQRRKNLEQIVRRASKEDKLGQGESLPEEHNCMFCDFVFDKYKLSCPNCQQTSQMCMASGERIENEADCIKLDHGLVIMKNILDISGKEVNDFVPS